MRLTQEIRLAVSRQASIITTNLGRCPRCMRSAFVTAVIASLLASAAAFTLARPVAVAAAAIATGFALLWLAHAFVFAWRWVRVTMIGEHVSLKSWSADVISRRRAMAVLMRAFAATLAASIIPSAAFAACNCGQPGCSCSDPAFPKCVYNPTRNESICCGPNGVPCGAMYMTYCCPPGTNCFGDGSKSPYCY